MYDHNQRLVPDAFVAIHVRNERLTVSRAALEQRYELCEDVAQQLAARLSAVADDDDVLQSSVLSATLSGLLEPPAQVDEPEARWIIHHVAELRGWSDPGDVDSGRSGSTPASD